MGQLFGVPSVEQSCIKSNQYNSAIKGTITILLNLIGLLNSDYSSKIIKNVYKFISLEVFTSYSSNYIIHYFISLHTVIRIGEIEVPLEPQFHCCLCLIYLLYFLKSSYYFNIVDNIIYLILYISFIVIIYRYAEEQSV